ncbi:cytochrome P450 [Desarmillaria ectypa]|nr:cytochrome P450 [Desarmillaria ectypa]
MLFITLVTIALFVFAWRRTLLLQRRPRSSVPLPPGPKPLWLLGNVFDLTAKELWLVVTKWGKKFGDVVYIHVFGQGLVFLNSAEAVSDLLDKRGSLYSDKPQLVMVGELCGCENMVAFTGYGDRMRRQRKLLTSALGVKAVPAYQPLMEEETQVFLRRLLATPDEHLLHTRRYAGGLTLSVVYGYTVSSNDDQFLRMAEECVDILSNRIASGGGLWPVDIFPSLKNWPLWAPGSGFRKNAMVWKAKMEEFVDKPFEYTLRSLKYGTYAPSFCSRLLEEMDNHSDQFMFDLKWSANSMYSASGDTTITTVMHFILAMILHPEVLEKARQEIDSVVGTERLPTFADRASLPYVDAILKETWRWGVPVPLCLPHRLMEDDMYRGMLIPKGSLVFGNIWSILRDESIYPNPDAFEPERFLKPVDPVTEKRRDVRNYVFGFGRRTCPGAHLVESSAWLLIASMLATLDMRKSVDDAGNVIEPVVEFDNSVFRTPNPYKCTIKPRSEQAVRVISQAGL